MSKRQVFLQLTAEFGGTKFGPFTQPEIRLGSEPGTNDIVLPEALGVAPEHVRLTKQQDDAFILAPTSRTTTVYLYKVDGRPAKQVTSPTTITEGDGFALVTQEGPRFTVVLEAERKEKADDEGKAKKKKGKDKLSAGTMFEEIKRQGLARGLATGVGQMGINAWTFIKSGAFLQPRYIILGLMLVSGWVFAGGMGCTAAGIGYQLQDSTAKLDTCQEQVQSLTGDDGGGDAEFSLPNTVSNLLKSPSYKKILQDEKLRVKLVERLKANGEQIEQFKWVWARKKSPYVDFRKRIDAVKKMPDAQKRLFAYIVVSKGENQENVWRLVRDSRGDNGCGRGPASITQRQARTMKFEPLALDVWVDTETKDTITPDLFFEKWKAANPGVKDITREGLGEFEVKISEETVGEGYCAYIDGEDARNEVKDIIPAIEKVTGTGSDGMPDESEDFFLASRLLKFYTADFSSGQSVLSSFKNKKPSAILDKDEIDDAAQEWALERVADTMAKAILVPCFSKLDRETQGKPVQITVDEPANLFQCGMLVLAMQYGELK